MKKILITGPTGFIGRNLILKLLNEGFFISVVEKEGANVTFLQEHNIPYFFYKNEFNELYEFMCREKPEGVIHLASLCILNHESEQIKEIVNSNILFPIHLLEASVKLNLKWFINTGTFWQHYNNKDYSPVNLYAASKQAFEDFARFYYESKNIKFTTIMLFDTFGPNDTRPKMFNSWLNSSLTGELFEMSPGEQIIDISYIDNITEGFFVLMKLMSNENANVHNGKIFKILSEKRMSLKDFAIFFENETGAKLNIAWAKNNYREREIMIPWEKGEDIPGFVPKVSLAEGIKLCFSALKNNI